MLEFDEIQYKHDWQKQHIYVDIALGNICNFCCSYCDPKLHNGSFPWHSIDDLKRFINKLFLHYTKIHNKKYFTFNFLGGEPSLYKNLTKFFNKNIYISCTSIRIAGSWTMKMRNTFNPTIFNHFFSMPYGNQY